ncbi:MAG TPA: hypothetical protein PLR83_07725 [Pyrinomonadaceae bacterium]|nr:hypothetical protein [Pyrinomonadaceae bacterium]
MRASYFHIASLLIVAVGVTLIVFIYSTQPKNLAEIATKSSVAIGTYEIDRAEFANGLAAFRRDEFGSARAAFDRADPEKRDAATQFYIAYSFYRQGWGRISNDNDLFAKGLSATERVLQLDPNYRSADTELGLKTPTELKAEFEDGLKVTVSDFNPLKLTRERK